jgi:flagellar biosynthesis/type III secretory pathway protein FliH
MRITETVKEGANSMCNISDLIEEEATKRGLEKGMQQGLQQGLQQGETKLGNLISILLKEGLTDVVERVAVDENVRAEYYKKYHID